MIRALYKWTTLPLLYLSIYTFQLMPSTRREKWFIKGEAMRLLKTKSSKTTLEESLEKFKQHLRTCGYPNSHRKVPFRALTEKKKAKEKILRLVTAPPSSEQPKTNTDRTMESSTKSA